MLRYRHHVNSSKIISPLVSLGCSLFADPNIMDLLQHRKNLARIGLGYGNKWLSAYKSSIISETRQDRTKVTVEDQ